MEKYHKNQKNFRKYSVALLKHLSLNTLFEMKESELNKAYTLEALSEGTMTF